ncbi:MAG: DUF1934 domain-containing protein [Bilifractor sp.]
MEKDVIISLKGFQHIPSNERAEPVEVLVPGTYFNKNGQHYVVYDELHEGTHEQTHNILKFTENRLLVHKKGTVDVEMLFEKEKRTSASYQTPFGLMNMQISATSFSLKEQEKRIDYKVGYSLTIEQGVTAECEIEIRIEARHGGGFHLTS